MGKSSRAISTPLIPEPRVCRLSVCDANTRLPDNHLDAHSFLAFSSIRGLLLLPPNTVLTFLPGSEPSLTKPFFGRLSTESYS